jgi:hypothetical protein
MQLDIRGLNGELFIILFWVITSNEFKPGG